MLLKAGLRASVLLFLTGGGDCQRNLKLGTFKNAQFGQK
jgi:hypothetical protein